MSLPRNWLYVDENGIRSQQIYSAPSGPHDKTCSLTSPASLYGNNYMKYLKMHWVGVLWNRWTSVGKDKLYYVCTQIQYMHIIRVINYMIAGLFLWNFFLSGMHSSCSINVDITGRVLEVRVGLLMVYWSCIWWWVNFIRHSNYCISASVMLWLRW